MTSRIWVSHVWSSSSRTKISTLQAGGRGIAAITVAGRRSGLELLAVLRERHLSRVAPVRAVASAPGEYRDGIARQHRFVPLPSNPAQHGRRISFKFPVGHRPALVLNIHVEIEVWVRPLHHGNDARQRD